MNGETLLAIAGGAILVLLTVVGYFLKGRDKRIGALESQGGLHVEKMAIIAGNLETISKRLSAGAESFKEITTTQKGLQETQTYIITNYVRKSDFDKFEEKISAKHEKIDRTIDGIKESVSDMKSTLMGMDQKINGGIRTMTDMLAKVVKIPSDPGDRE